MSGAVGVWWEDLPRDSTGARWVTRAAQRRIA